jgi:Xaa-Pro aminopeptidase
MTPFRLLAILVALPVLIAAAQPAPERPLGTMREQAAVQQRWLEARLEQNLPAVMRAQGVDMWVVAMREYNEDPVFRALVSPTTFAARRRSIYVFYDRGPALGVERLALGGTSQGGLFRAVRDNEPAPDGRPRELWGTAQWDFFARIVRERNPAAIAVNISHEHNFADGLAAGEWEQMQAALGPDFAARIVRNERLAIDYLSLRLPDMLPTFRRIQELAHEIITTAFSHAAITPGVTTTDDVVWWMRQRLADLGLTTWFQPSVDVQRRGVVMQDSVAPVILRGDILHCDFGITALGLNTDTQHMGYVLRDGEAAPPAGLRAALAASNQLQDIAMAEMRPGRSGNAALTATLGRMRAAGLDGTVYSHPVGDHGHGAGPLIGMWDRQDGVPGRGDVPILAGTWFSIELQAATTVPEWDGQLVRSMQEEDAAIDASGAITWVVGRQTEYHLVR